MLGVKKNLLLKQALAACCLIILTISSSCDSDAPKLSDLAIFVSPDNSKIVEVASGEKVLYEISTSTIHDCIESLTITSFDKLNGDKVLLSQTVGQKKFNTNFIFTAPELNIDECVTVLTFTITDNLGNTTSVKRNITIINQNISVPEKTGIILYSPFSGMPDALSLNDVSRPFSLADSPNPLLADVYVESSENFMDITWKSNTQTKFIRNNSFNYTEANAYTINATYNSSVRYDIIKDIKPNDIIIVGHGMLAQGVFLVTLVQQSALPYPYMIVSYKGLQMLSDNEDNDFPEQEQLDDKK